MPTPSQEGSTTYTVTASLNSSGQSDSVSVVNETTINGYNTIVGSPGQTGPTGPAGQGVAAGGSAGQYLKKNSSTNYDDSWVSIAESDVSGLVADLAAKLDTSATGQSKAGTLTVPLYDKGGMVYNAKAYLATGNGVLDDTAYIQNALNAANPGSKVVLPAGIYRTSVPLLLPPHVTLEGVKGNIYLTTGYGTVIKPLSTFSQGTAASAAVILICDQASGGWAIPSNEQTVGNLYIDQSSMVKGTNWADGIEILGDVSGYNIHDVQVNQCTSTAIHSQTNGSGEPGTGRLTHILTQGSYYSGFGIISNDTTYIDCVSLGDGTNGYAGWTIASAGNNRWIGCRAEWATGDGFNINNSTPYNLAQTMNFIGCSTDRNSKNGFYVTGSARTAINFSGCYVHRDGRNGGAGGGGYGHFNITDCAGMVNISGCSTAPGVDDDGSGPDSPQYSLVTSGTNGMIMVDGTVLHGFSASINNAGTNTFFLVSPTCLLATGADSSPTFGTPLALPISSGGTGSTTKNFVDLTNAQAVGGVKTFSGANAYGTPTSITLTNAGGLPVGGISATGTPSSTTYLRGDGIWSTVAAGGGGISRSVNSVSTPTTAGAAALTDYVYFVSGTTTLTLPTAVGNTDRYTVKNTGVATVTVATTSAQTIDGSTTASLPVANTSIDLISDGSNWRVV